MMIHKLARNGFEIADFLDEEVCGLIDGVLRAVGAAANE